MIRGALTPEDIRRELAGLGMALAAEHMPARNGFCPVCRTLRCVPWMGALEVLRSANVAVPLTPVCEPVRPAWVCDAHGEPWPCYPTRGLLGDAYGIPGRPMLLTFMAGLMVDAARECGDPAGELVDRFVTWVVRLWWS